VSPGPASVFYSGSYLRTSIKFLFMAYVLRISTNIKIGFTNFIVETSIPNFVCLKVFSGFWWKRILDSPVRPDRPCGPLSRRLKDIKRPERDAAHL